MPEQELFGYDERGARSIVLETRTRGGRWIPTKVSFVVDGPRLLFRTWSASGKAKRLRNHGHVRFHTVRDEAHTYLGRARLLQGPASDHAAVLINRKYPFLQGMGVRAMHWLRGYETQHYAIEDLEVASSVTRPNANWGT